VSNLLAKGFDVPQTRPQRPRPFEQSDDWYAEQRPTTTLPFDVFSAHTHYGVQDYREYIVFDVQPRPYRNFLEELRKLQKHYLLLDEPQRIIELLRQEPSLYMLLTEAIEPLHRAFGGTRIIHARVQASDDGNLLKVAVQLPLDFAEPEHALRSFDENWWLNNCYRSGGALVFDYEMQDAV